MKVGDQDIKQIKIVFDVEKQRYDTEGDYKIVGKELVIKVLKMHPALQLGVMIHELVESILCLLEKIDFKKIDKFDIDYEKVRSKGKKFAPCGCLIQYEPGNDIHAPYHNQHQIARKFEHDLAFYLEKFFNDEEETI